MRLISEALISEVKQIQKPRELYSGKGHKKRLDVKASWRKKCINVEMPHILEFI